MFGLIMAGLGLAYQIIFPLRSHSYVNAKIVMIFHFIAGKCISTVEMFYQKVPSARKNVECEIFFQKIILKNKLIYEIE